MDLVIKNCNNIDEAKIAIQPGRLNLKYGPNGLGKSTIAKALTLAAIDGGNKLIDLQPFKHRGKQSLENLPAIDGAAAFKSVMTFNEEYVEQFVFQQDEIVKNSFEIFVRNADYEEKMKQIEALVVEIKEAFTANKDIDAVLADLSELSESFGKSKEGMSRASKMFRGIGKGNKLEHIPEKLSPYANFIKSESNTKWIKWQIDGNQFLQLSASCPYCTSPTEDKKETILAVSEEYDAKAIEHLLAVQSVFARLGKYFSDETQEKLSGIVKSKVALKKEELNYLVAIKHQTDTLHEKLADAKNISFFSLRDVGKVQEKLTNLKIDLSLIPMLKSASSAHIVDAVNKCLDAVLGKAGQLEGEVNKQKAAIEKTIKRYKDEINTFLKNAGYRYEVDMQVEANAYKMRLKHRDFAEYIANGDNHLSYGERNAFSLVLFMYECLTRKPDLVVLDDPISSFDKTKKFAILEMLFRGKNSLQGRTVMLLTHDIEPVIDLVKSLAHSFNPIPLASFLTSTAGCVSETEVVKADIMSFGQICTQNVQASGEVVVQLVYLRRNYEIIDNRGDEYQLISSLLHKRAKPTTTKDGNERELTQGEIAAATDRIAEKLPGFNYANVLARLNDLNTMLAVYKAAKNRYEKLQLFRIVSPEAPENDVVRKYINETYHIENEYIMQLNPTKFDAVPEHIIDQCDELLGLKAAA